MERRVAGGTARKMSTSDGLPFWIAENDHDWRVVVPGPSGHVGEVSLFKKDPAAPEKLSAIGELIARRTKVLEPYGIPPNFRRERERARWINAGAGVLAALTYMGIVFLLGLRKVAPAAPAPSDGSGPPPPAG